MIFCILKFSIISKVYITKSKVMQLNSEYLTWAVRQYRACRAILFKLRAKKTIVTEDEKLVQDEDVKEMQIREEFAKQEQLKDNLEEKGQARGGHPPQKQISNSQKVKTFLERITPEVEESLTQLAQQRGESFKRANQRISTYELILVSCLSEKQRILNDEVTLFECLEKIAPELKWSPKAFKDKIQMYLIHVSNEEMIQYLEKGWEFTFARDSKKLIPREKVETVSKKRFKRIRSRAKMKLSSKELIEPPPEETLLRLKEMLPMREDKGCKN